MLQTYFPKKDDDSRMVKDSTHIPAQGAEQRPLIIPSYHRQGPPYPCLILFLFISGSSPRVGDRGTIVQSRPPNPSAKGRVCAPPPSASARAAASVKGFKGKGEG